MSARSHCRPFGFCRQALVQVLPPLRADRRRRRSGTSSPPRLRTAAAAAKAKRAHQPSTRRAVRCCHNPMPSTKRLAFRT
eukprot:scaffold90928_cov28-Tisochrysis_lutea.AAC.7